MPECRCCGNVKTKIMKEFDRLRDDGTSYTVVQFYCKMCGCQFQRAKSASYLDRLTRKKVWDKERFKDGK